MAKSADAADLKSAGRKAVGVQVPLRAPARVPQNNRLVGPPVPDEKQSATDAADFEPHLNASVKPIRLKLHNLIKVLEQSRLAHLLHIFFSIAELFSVPQSALDPVCRESP